MIVEGDVLVHKLESKELSLKSSLKVHVVVHPTAYPVGTKSPKLKKIIAIIKIKAVMEMFKEKFLSAIKIFFYLIPKTT